jgi:hypothetical protein
LSVLTNSSTSRPSSSNLRMFIRSITTRAPVGSTAPAGDWAKGRAKVPSIHVWHAMKSPSATMTPDTAVVERGPERPEVLGQPRVVGVEAVGTVEDEVLGVEIRVDLLRVLAGDLQLSGPLPRSPGRHGAAPVVPYDRSLSRSCRPRDSRISYLILTSPSGAIKVPISYPICWLLPGACGNDRGPSGRPDRPGDPTVHHRHTGAD